MERKRERGSQHPHCTQALPRTSVPTLLFTIALTQLRDSLSNRHQRESNRPTELCLHAQPKRPLTAIDACFLCYEPDGSREPCASFGRHSVVFASFTDAGFLFLFITLAGPTCFRGAYRAPIYQPHLQDGVPLGEGQEKNKMRPRRKCARRAQRY